MGIRLFSYFGSKVRIARQYPRPIYPTIVEPFAGAAGYSCRYHTRQCILYDINPQVYAVLNYLIKASPEEIMALPLLKDEDKIKDLDLSQAAKWLIGFWAAAAGASPAGSLHQWARDDPRVSSWGKECRKRLSMAVRRIKHWRAYNLSWESINPAKIGPATWFIDPPYQEAGKSYKYGSKGIDYKALAAWCRSLPGQVIVCENEGADWLPFRPFVKMVGHLKEGDSRKITREAVWTKGCHEYPSLLRSGG